MLRIFDAPFVLDNKINRRNMLALGSAALPGVLSLIKENQSLGNELPGRSPVKRAKACILICLMGGPAQLDTWDPKPESPSDIRGEGGCISTSVPGEFVGEWMPKIAGLLDKISVLRSVSTNDNAHSSSGYYMLTGRPHNPMNSENAKPSPLNESPCIGSLIKHEKRDSLFPSAIALPDHLWNDGNIRWPGQDAGFLGKRSDPWHLHCDPAASQFHFPELQRPSDVSSMRFQRRGQLLEQLEHQTRLLERSKSVKDYGNLADSAAELISSGKFRTSLDLRLEKPGNRARYGKTKFGQSLLMARRLVEAGVSLVQVNWPRVAVKPNGTWDTHSNHFGAMKNVLMPIMDQAYSALLNDLEERGLLDETLVIWWGEFGRSPKVYANPLGAGRNHWGYAFSIAMAGGGIRQGYIHGKTDSIGAFPEEGLVKPEDLTATILHLFGIHPEKIVHDRLSRPLPLSSGTVIDALIS